MYSATPVPTRRRRLVQGTGRGARETVLGTLGKATILRIPPELQNLTRCFGAAMWKRDTEDPRRKLVLLNYVDSFAGALATGSCTVTLNCPAERGDNVSYSWGSRDASTLGFCSHNGSLLHLSYPLQNASIACACTASNPVSSRVVPFNSSECSYEQGGSAGLRMEHLVLVVVVPIAAVMMLTGLFMATHLAMPI
ncbi:PREDICTED: signaling lymphocytic activation molecule-like, partial [Fulmarus glacialis]|uniref:signaling lymphocytic activation molecule-like n=1 Tax=Fulmarus glacialis TaxID=30455 RepID=UPI00051C20DD